MNTKEKNNPFLVKCSQCDKMFSARGMKAHIRFIHSDKPRKSKNMNQIEFLINVIDGFNKKPQEALNLLESVKSEYYRRLHANQEKPKKTKVGRPIGKPKEKKYNITEERRQELREWAKKMQEIRAEKKKAKEAETLVEPKKYTWKDKINSLVKK